jgi:hypothetical protein
MPSDVRFVFDDIKTCIRVETFVCFDGGNYVDNAGSTAASPSCLMAGHTPRDQ